MTSLQVQYLTFWTELRDDFAKNNSPVRLTTPRSQSWTSAPIDRPGYFLALAVNHRKAEGIVAAIDIVHKNSGIAFEQLRRSDAAIAQELGEKLVWERLESKYRVAIYHRAEFNDPHQRTAIKQWFRMKAEDLYRVFNKWIDGLSL